MQTKKIFISSLNNLDLDFWKMHLELNNATVYHSKDTTMTLSRLETFNPDVIIIDGYWATESVDAHLEEILEKNINANIFCLTPSEEVETQLRPLHGQLFISRLSTDVLGQINNIIQPYTRKTNSPLFLIA